MAPLCLPPSLPLWHKGISKSINCLMNATNDNTSSPASAPRRRLGILQAGRSPDALLNQFPDYNRMFVDLLGEGSFDYLHWPVLDGVFPNSVDDADAWLITGSRFGAYEDHDWIPPLEDLYPGSLCIGQTHGRYLLWTPDHRAGIWAARLRSSPVDGPWDASNMIWTRASLAPWHRPATPPLH